MKNIKLAIVLIFIFGVIVVSEIHNRREKKSLEKNLKRTEAVVVDFTHGSKSDYYVKYKFQVDLIMYQGKVLTSYFKCDDGTPGCQWKSFEVGYDANDPNNNDIDLGRYNKHKKSMNSIFGD